ncbi:hypothetical protein ACHHYP_16404 [Achlya hypogyna]|uniref:HTH CENPB-type domain-containing protein n=1 Tax=Achlya hypogyna TaxID=1202772 RepID=A0A1V9Y864_ACHHY|nr:hypothetical protein ACHHYP_16404 [Achlya hypogyna]
MTKKARKKATPKSRAVSTSKATRKHAAINIYNRLHILDYHHESSGNQTRTARHFRANGFPTLDQATISRMVQDEAKWRDLGKTDAFLEVVRVRSVRHPQFDQALSIWVDQIEAAQFNGLTGNAIRSVAWHVYTKLKVPDDERTCLSEGWLDSFKARNGLRMHRFHGEAASISPEDVDRERARLQVLLTSAFDNGYDINDIYNFDETSFLRICTR